MNQYYRPGGFGRFSLFPPVIKTLIIINAVVFLVEMMFGSLRLGDYSLYGLIREYLYLHPIDGTYFDGRFIGNFFYPWQLITYQFLHGGIFHIFFNLFALWMFGTELEAKWGSRKFVTYYLLSGIGAGLVQMLITNVPTVGASGAVYGILLAFALTNPDRPIFFMLVPIPIKAKYFVIILVGISLLSGYSNNPNDNVAHFAHLAGMGTGFLLFKFGDKIGIYSFFNKIYDLFRPVNKPKSGTGYKAKTYDGATVYSVNWEETKKKESSKVESNSQGSMKINGEEITQKKVDEILDKISAGGYQSLTEKEKQILFELSQKLK